MITNSRVAILSRGLLRTYLIFTFSLLILLPSVHGQKIFLEGFVKDGTHKSGLAFGNVYLQKDSRGTVTNENGEFRLICGTLSNDDTLVVSYLGYETKRIPVNFISGPVNILLRKDTITFAEILVTDYSAETILKKAIENIPLNYPSKPYVSRGFYRVSSTRGSNYVHLSEAVFDIYHSGNQKNKQQLRLDKMRQIKDDNLSKGLDLGLSAESIFAFDLVNNRDAIGLLTKHGLKDHHFKVVGLVNTDDGIAYRLSFDQIGTKDSGYQGSILIEKESFAFLQFDFGISKKGLPNKKFGKTSLRAMLKILGIRITMLKDNYSIQYKKIGSGFCLNSVTNDASLNIKSDRENYDFIIDTKVDYFTNYIDRSHLLPFPQDEVLRRNQMIEKENFTYDHDYWKDYTILIPDRDFSTVAKKIDANNRNHDLKSQLEDRLDKFPKNVSVRLDSIMSFFNRRNLFNGNVLIVRGEDILLKKSYNNALTTNTLNSRFRIGSVSKTFTSMLIMQLQEEGFLNLEDTIGRFLPTYKYPGITIHQLLSHQTGIPDFIRDQENFYAILNQHYSITQLVQGFCSDSLHFQPGTKFEYSNSNYLILYQLIEKVSGKSFDEVLHERIFKPLHMQNSSYASAADSSRLAVGYLYGKPEPKYTIENMGGAGGIITTAQDLLIWSKALNSDELITDISKEKLFKRQAEYLDWQAYYGYGWMIDKSIFSVSKKHQIIYHPGTDFGFHSMFVKQPDQDITIILLANTGEFPRFEITDILLKVINDL